MAGSRSPRTDGRGLVTVIESADNNGLRALSALSPLAEKWVAQLGYDTTGWPADVPGVLRGTGANRRWELPDADGQSQAFALVEMTDYDILFSVGSRRAANVPGVRSENLATNVILDLLATPGVKSQRLYGRLVANHSSRIIRNEVAGAFVVRECRNWLIEVLCEDLRWNPAVDANPYGMAVAVTSNSESATHTVKNGARHKHAAFEKGQHKWSRAQLTPIVQVHPDTKAMSWDRHVCEALRAVVTDLRAGDTWQKAALAHGHRIPSYVLQAEPDAAPEGSGQRSRSDRNAQREAAGRPTVELRYLADGQPNPRYQPETLLDVVEPGVNLRALFLAGIGTRDAVEAVGDLVDSELDGIDPKDATLELLRSGVLRRLVKDPDESTDAVAVYGYITFALPAYEISEDGEPHNVLSDDDVEFLKRFRAKGGHGGAATLPLSEFFTVRQTEALYTDHGLVTPAKDGSATITGADGNRPVGRLSFVSQAGHKDGPLYKIRFDPFDPQKSSRVGVAALPAETLTRSVLSSIYEALGPDARDAYFTLGANPGYDRELDEVARNLQGTCERHMAAVDALINSDLSPVSRRILEGKVADAEAAYVEAKAYHDEFVEQSRRVARDTLVLDTLVDLLAVLESPGPLEPALVRKIRARLRMLVKDAWIAVLADAGGVQWGAELELRADSGRYLRVPIGGLLSNEAGDLWLGGAPGIFWSRRVSVREAMNLRGLSSKTSDRWRKHIERRLQAEGEKRGRRFRGPHALSLLVRTPYREVVDATFRILFDEAPSDEQLDAEVRRLFLSEGADLPNPFACDWSASQKGAKVARLREIVQELRSSAAA